MSIRALQDYTYYSKYARFNQKAKRRETWNEAVDRVFAMHLDKYPHCQEEIEWVVDLVKNKRVLGSQRALQFGGEPIKKKNARMYNCTVSFCDRLRFFQECFWLLLCGCGTGFSVQKHHIAKIPAFSKKIGTKGKKTFVIPDTIEGWADALGVLMGSFFQFDEFKEWEGHIVEFDYSQIRAAGSVLASGVGKAPGPEPLKRALNIIQDLLKNRSESFDRLRPIDAYDIVMHASDAVLSGGVRRSATICIFSFDDEEMANAKTGNWFNENPQRGRSNNSALLVRNEITREQFNKLMESVKEYGEPGFYWSDSTEQLPNPCFDKDTRIATDKGMVKIIDLFNEGKENVVLTDMRAGKGDLIDNAVKGVKLLPSSRVHLTQKQAAIFELMTEHGHSIKTTANHEFPTTSGRRKLHELQPGDVLLLPSDEGVWGNVGTFEQGVLLGLITGDGTFASSSEAFVDLWEDDFDQTSYIHELVNKEISKLPSISNGGREYGCVEWVNQTSTENSAKKRIGGRRLYRMLKETLKIDRPESVKDEVPECVWRGSRDFVKGYLQGLFFADGGPQLSGHKKKATLSYRLNQSNQVLLRQIQVLLNNFGIVSRISQRREAGERLLPDGNGGKKLYQCKANFELIISRPNFVSFMSKVGALGRKATIAETMLACRGTTCNKPERFITRVKAVSYSHVDDVYCLTQPETNTVVANGVVTGQCVEIGMWPVDVLTGESGWQFCNLCEINGRKIKCKEDFALAARGAAIVGTLQAGYDKFDYLGEVTERIVRREALLGVSITGMQDNPEVIFDEKVQREMAKLVLETNEWMAKKIGIQPAARATCVKPAGTTSCILGTGSGIHPHHAKRYFRRVQANSMEPVLQWFKKTNPHAVETSVWSANKTDEVITFCVEVPDGAKTKNDLNAIELLELVKKTQQNWVNYGKRKEACTQEWLTHNVSNTINVRADEWDSVASFIYDNRKWFAGVSLLPSSGDLDYPQAPMCNVLNPKEILAAYGDGALLASGLIVDGLYAFKNNLWKACDAVNGLGDQIEDKETDKLNWIRRVKQFADRYCGGDVRKCCYLMKHVNNWKTWLDLKREYADVDYTQLIEETDETTPMETIACAGGKCEISFHK